MAIQPEQVLAQKAEAATALTNGTSSHQAPLDASKLIFTRNPSPRAVPALDSPEVASQSVCTDHMISVRWTEAHGWEAPELKPYGPLSLMPTASVLHYATECFEGMKVYRGFDGGLRLFRPRNNCNRMVTSSARIALPAFDPAQLEALITALVAVDGPRWLPKDRAGSFLYLRPTHIASAAALGVQRPKETTLFVIACLFPNMDVSTGLELLASSEDTVRAWPGGFGYAKVGANYGPSLLAQGDARARGFDQILWLLGPDAAVTEAGASNFFVVWRARDTGRIQLVTAPLDDRIILPGITRDSVLSLARERLAAAGEGGLEPIEVVERKFYMRDVVEAVAEGRLMEAFAAGTAFFIAPVKGIHFRGADLEIPMPADGYANTIKSWLGGIMYGKVSHKWGVVVEERE